MFEIEMLKTLNYNWSILDSWVSQKFRRMKEYEFFQEYRFTLKKQPKVELELEIELHFSQQYIAFNRPNVVQEKRIFI